VLLAWNNYYPSTTRMIVALSYNGQPGYGYVNLAERVAQLRPLIRPRARRLPN